MTTCQSSPMELVNAALIEHNPFAQPPVVCANHVWGKGFPDAKSLNAHASDAVFQVLDDIRTHKYAAASILITAQDGTGKSHIISRIRHHLQNMGGAFFILANKFTNLNQVKEGFQQLLSESLLKVGSQAVTQWQELATSMANEALIANNPQNKAFAPKDLVSKFVLIKNSSKTLNLINQLTKRFCQLKSVQDPDIIRAIFWTLVEDEAAYAANWLAGKELAQYKANDLRLPTQNQSFDTVLQVLGLISEYNSLVLCFDELDLAEFNDAGFRKAQVIANLVKELVENLQRGVILSVMMPGTWKEEVLDKMPRAVSTKMSTFSDPLNLKYLDADTTIELVACFLKDYYEAKNLTPPHSIYPFDPGQLQAIGREKPTVRDVLKWCKEHCKPNGGNLPFLPNRDLVLEAVEAALTAELNDDISARLDDNQFIADALFFSFEHLVGQEVHQFKIQQVTTGVTQKGKRDYYLNFKVIGQDAGKQTSIGVAVLQYDGGTALGAGFKRLLDIDSNYSLTRGCLVRSYGKFISKFIRTKYLDPLIAKGGEFVDLIEEQVKPLVAIHSVYQKRESDYDISEADIFRFIKEKGQQYGLGDHNPLIQEILSDPSYTIPANLPDEPDSVVLDALDALDENLQFDTPETIEDLDLLTV